MPLTQIRRGLLRLGVAILIAAPSLSVGSVWARRRHIAEFQEAALSSAVLTDTVVRASIVDHLSRLQAEDQLRWSPTGDLTLGVCGTLAGLVLVVTSLRRRA